MGATTGSEPLQVAEHMEEMQNRSAVPAHRRADLLALAAYVVLSLLLCYPLPLRLGSDVAGRYVDARVFQWNNWWVKRALFEGLDLDYSDAIYYPSGVSLASHNVNWFSSFLSVPLDLLWGPVVAYNLLFLLTFWLSGFGMYLLALHLTGRRDAALLAGLVYAFFPYHLSGNWDGQMNLANVQWLPLFVLFLLRTVEHKRVWDALSAGLFVALAGLDCWFYLLFLGMWGALYAVYSLVTEREKWGWRGAGLLLLAGVTGGALMAPLLVPAIAELMGGTAELALAYHAEDKASDLLAFVVPSSDHPLLGELARPVYERFRHWRPASLGYAALLLASYAVLARPRRALLWLLSGLLFLALALGTTLTVGGVQYPQVPTPYRLLTDLLPMLKIVRQANRFNVMVGLSLAALAGVGWADLARRMGQRVRPGVWKTPQPRAQWPATALASALVLFEYLALPCPLQPGAVSPFYHALAREAEGRAAFALLELPIDDFHSRESLYPQTVHGQKLVNGYVARTPPGAQAFIRSQPLLVALHVQMEVDPALHDIEREIGLLAANDIRYVVIHKRALPPQPPVNEEVMGGWRALFGPGAAYEDDEIVAYRTQLAHGQGKTPLLTLGEALGVTEVRARRVWLLPPGDKEEWLAVDLTWTALFGLEDDYACRLALLGPGGTQLAYAEAEPISPRYPTSRWPAGVVVADLYALPLDPGLPAGEYRLVVALLDAATGAERAAAEYPIQVAAEAEPMVPALAEMGHPAGVDYGGQMRLLGYSAEQRGERLEVALYWQALVAMQRKYKVFVHLLRAPDGAIVAQHDAMPRDWSYPTTLWGRREVYVERIALDVSDAAAGTYRLVVGVYEPQSGRLVTVDASGNPLPDDRAVLAEPIEVGKR